MLKEPKNNISYKKMSGAGNDFIIVDGRGFELEISANKIAELSDRKNIGCDQFIVLRDSKKADCLMEIYNSDGSIAGACGNATRCVAAILCDELQQNNAKIETCSEILSCLKNDDKIEVEFNAPKFFAKNFSYEGFDFILVDVGNPHAVCFCDKIPNDDIFFKIGKEVESHEFFKNKTNVEFAKIIDKSTIEVRVFERGAGETLACGTGACAVGVAAINQKLVKSPVLTKFKGGDIEIKWSGEKITMIGGFELIAEGFFALN